MCLALHPWCFHEVNIVLRCGAPGACLFHRPQFGLQYVSDVSFAVHRPSLCTVGHWRPRDLVHGLLYVV